MQIMNGISMLVSRLSGGAYTDDVHFRLIPKLILQDRYGFIPMKTISTSENIQKSERKCGHKVL